MRQLRDWLLDLIGTLRQLYSNEISEEEVTEGLSNTLADEQQQDKTPESDHQTDPRDAPRNGPRWPKIIYTGLPGLPRKQYQMPNALSTDIAVPRSLDEALSLPQGDKCKTSLHPIGCKITVKRDKDGNFHCFKSRLVAKVCSQRWGINYSETFSPVSRYSTIRLVIALSMGCTFTKWMYHRRI